MLRFALAVVFSCWTITDAVRIAEEDSKDSNSHVKAHVNKTSPLNRHRLSTQPHGNGDGPPVQMMGEENDDEADCIVQVDTCQHVDWCESNNATCVNMGRPGFLCVCAPGTCGKPNGGGGLYCEGEGVGTIKTSHEVTNLGRGLEGDLGDRSLTAMLAAVSEHVYNFKNVDDVLGNPPKLRLLKKAIQGDEGTGFGGTGSGATVNGVSGGSDIQYGIYEIIDPRSAHRGKRILSFRGTWTMEGLKQDADMMRRKAWSPDHSGVLDSARQEYSQDHRFAKAVQQAEMTLKTNGYLMDDVPISFVTGHSLGAALAEITAWKTKTPGAGFNGPAICSPNEERSWCNAPGQGHRTHGVFPFEVWTTDNDPVSSMSAIKGSVDDGHITRPKHGSCNEGGWKLKLSTAVTSQDFSFTAHSMECMFIRVGKLTWF